MMVIVIPETVEKKFTIDFENFGSEARELLEDIGLVIQLSQVISHVKCLISLDRVSFGNLNQLFFEHSPHNDSRLILIELVYETKLSPETQYERLNIELRSDLCCKCNLKVHVVRKLF